MKFLVTGATGFIGRRLVRRLVSDDHEVVAVVRRPEHAPDLRALGVDLRRGDITDRESLRAPMTGVDAVFHLAGWYEVGSAATATAEAINVEGTRNVLGLMRELEVPKGVYTSTLAVFGDTRGRVVDESYLSAGPWLSEYDRTKWVAHYLVAEPLIRAGLPLVIVQPGLVYGPGDSSLLAKTLRQYLRGRLPILPRGNAYCFGHIDDTVDGHLKAMELGRYGESYIIAGPPSTLEEVFELAEAISGLPGPRLQAPPRLIRGAATAAGLLERLVKLPEQYRAETLRATSGVTYLGSNRKAREELGFAPRSLAVGLPGFLDSEIRRLGMPPLRHAV